MTKSKKIVIGLVSIVLLFGMYYLYLIYKTVKISSYYAYCYEVDNNHTTDEMCSKVFQETCQNTDGKVKKTIECKSHSGDFTLAFCLDKNVKCICPFFKTWKDEQGCI